MDCWLTTELGWGNMIDKIRLKTRQRTALIVAIFCSLSFFFKVLRFIKLITF